MMKSIHTSQDFDRGYFTGGKKKSPYDEGYYSEDNICLTAFRFELLLRHLQEKGFEPAKCRILEIGCATGLFLKLCEARGMETYGIDISQYAINTSSPFLNAKLVALNIEEDKIPFPDDYFDVVVCFTVLEHLFQPDKALRKILKILKPEGIIYCDMPVLPRLFRSEKKTKFIFLQAEKILNILNKSLLSDSTHVSIFTHHKWRHLIEENGGNVWCISLYLSIPFFKMKGVILNPVRKVILRLFPSLSVSAGLWIGKSRRYYRKHFKYEILDHYRRFAMSEDIKNLLFHYINKLNLE